MQKLIFNLAIVAALIVTTVACSSSNEKQCNGSCDSTLVDSVKVDSSAVVDTAAFKSVIDSVQP
jgi:hypothetical protein